MTSGHPGNYTSLTDVTLVAVPKALFNDPWNMRRAKAAEHAEAFRSEAKTIDKTIMNRIVESARTSRYSRDQLFERAYGCPSMPWNSSKRGPLGGEKNRAETRIPRTNSVLPGSGCPNSPDGLPVHGLGRIVHRPM